MQSGRRRDPFQYGGEVFLEASRFLQRVVPGASHSQAPERVSPVAGARATCGLIRGLPRIEVRLTGEPAGERLSAHFGHRLWGIRHARVAQGVLVLPAEPGRYARGRSRQAVRTNMRKARAAGIACRPLDSAWTQRATWQGLGRRVDTADEDRFAIPGDRWWGAFAPDGGPVAFAQVTVDREIALLQTLASLDRPTRYLLHTQVVEALVGANVRYLVASAPMAPLLEPALQYWQRLLGYQIANLSVSTASPARWELRVAEVDAEPAVSTP